MSQILLCYIPLFLICLRVRRPRFFQDPNTVSTGYFFKHFFGFCFFWGGESCHSGVSTSSTVRNHSCWLRGPFGSICPGLAACKVNATLLCYLSGPQVTFLTGAIFSNILFVSTYCFEKVPVILGPLLKTYSLFFIQGSLLPGLGTPYGMLGLNLV